MLHLRVEFIATLWRIQIKCSKSREKERTDRGIISFDKEREREIGNGSTFQFGETKDAKRKLVSRLTQLCELIVEYVVRKELYAEAFLNSNHINWF